jgi:hypothetical protein
MSTMTRRATNPAALAPDWRVSAACSGTDVEDFFSDSAAAQAYAQRVCQRCPVRRICLTDAVGYEHDGYMLWGVVGGLTSTQRRALRCEAFLGNRPNLRQAHVLASPKVAGVLRPVLDWPADLVAGELRKHGLLASPVTVRVALWWAGGKGGVLGPRQEGDGRYLWERVRDESREVVEQLRGMGFGRRDVAAYLMVSEDAIGKAVHAWRAGDAAIVEGVAA